MKRKAIILPVLLFLLGIGLISYSLWNLLQAHVGIQEKREEKEITMIVQESRYYTGLKNMIKKLYVEEGIRIKVRVLPDNQAESVIQMMINSGDYPDMLDANIPHIYNLINPCRYLADFTEESWVSKLTNPQQVTYSDGRIYGFPFLKNSGVGGIIYNKDIFEKYGIAIPESEEDFYNVCERLKSLGISPVLLCADNWIPQIWMNYGFPLSFGSDKNCKKITEEILSGKKKLGDYEESYKVIDTYLGLFEKGYVNNDYMYIDYNDMIDKLNNQEGAMVFGYSTMIPVMNQHHSNLNMGMFVSPFAYNQSKNIVYLDFSVGFVSFRESENLDVVKEVLDKWSQKEYLSMWIFENGGDPAFEDVPDNVNKDIEYLYKSYVETGKTVGEFMLYMDPIYSLNQDKLWLYYREAPKNHWTADELLEKIEIDIEEKLEK